MSIKAYNRHIESLPPDNAIPILLPSNKDLFNTILFIAIIPKLYFIKYIHNYKERCGHFLVHKKELPRFFLNSSLLLYNFFIYTAAFNASNIAVFAVAVFVSLLKSNQGFAQSNSGAHGRIPAIPLFLPHLINSDVNLAASSSVSS